MKSAHELGVGLACRHGQLRGRVDLRLHLRLDLFELLPAHAVVLAQEAGGAHDRVALRLALPLGGRFVQALVVRERVRVGPHHVGVHQRRPLARADPGHRLTHDTVRLDEVAAVYLEDRQVGKSRNELGDRPAGHLHVHRHRDRVAVVLDHVKNGQPTVAGGVQGLPELPFRGGAVSEGEPDHLIGCHPGALVGLLQRQQVPPRLGEAHRLQALRAGR